MGGAGSILGMIQSYRDNMRQLRKSAFRNKDRIEETKFVRHDSNGQKIKVKHLSEEERQKFINQTIENSRKSRRRVLFIFVSVAVLIMTLSFFLLSSLSDRVVQNRKDRQQFLNASKQHLYIEHITNGDGWCDRQKWDKAIAEYKKLEYIFPNDYLVKFKIAYATSHNCLNNDYSCDEAISRLDELIKEYPLEKDLYELRAKVFIAIGESELASMDYEKIDDIIENEKNNGL
jgi:hypothetical protein